MYLSHVYHCVWRVYNLHFPHLAAAVPWVSFLVKHLLNPENIRKQRNPWFRITAVKIAAQAITAISIPVWHVGLRRGPRPFQAYSERWQSSLSYCKLGWRHWGEFSPLSTFQIGFEENRRICIGKWCAHSRISVPEVLTVVSFRSNILPLRIRDRKPLGSHDMHIYPKSLI